MKTKIWAYLKDDSGQTSTEYILLVAVVAAIVFKFREKAMGYLFGEGGGGNGNGLMDKIFNSRNLTDFE